LKRFFRNILKLVLLIALSLSSGLALVSHYSGSWLDPESLLVTITTLSSLLSYIPSFLVWIIFIGSSGYLVFSVNRRV